MRIRNRLAVVVAAFAPLLMTGTPAEGVFMGDITFPTFPCSGPSCIATFTTSLAAGTTVKLSPGIATVTGLSATFYYSDYCAGGLAFASTASGTMTLTGTNIVGSALPLTFPFQWLRVGLVMVITSTSSQVQAGAAIFQPHSGLPTCTGGSMTATIVGDPVCLHTSEGVVCLY